MRTMRTARWLAVVSFLAPGSGRAAPEPATAAPTAPAATDPGLAGQDIDHPPPGPPEDVALWRAGLQVTIDVPIERARASRLQQTFVTLRYLDRLEVLAARGGTDRERAQGITQRISQSFSQQAFVQTAKWPIDPYRVCGYPAMQFGSMLATGNSTRDELAQNRAILRGCVEGAQEALRLQRETDDRFEAALAEAEKALKEAKIGLDAVAPKPTPAAAGTPGSPRPAGK